MKKEEKELRRLFAQDAAREYVSAERKRQAVRLLLEANDAYGAESGSESGDRTLASHLGRLSMQLKYMDKRLYVLQCTVLAAAVIIGAGIYGTNISSTFSEAAYVYATFSSVAFGTIAVIACNIGDRRGLAELAGSCYFNHRQVCVLRMALSGAVSLVSMGSLLCVAHVCLGSPLWQMGIYMLVPYLVTGCVLFAMLGIERLGRSQYVLWAGGLVMAVVFGVVASVRGTYEKAALGTWILVMVLSAMVLALEMAVLFRKMEKGDMLCMN